MNNFKTGVTEIREPLSEPKTESRSLRERRLEVPWHLESGPEQQWGDSVAICYGTGGGQFCIMYKEDVAGNRALLEHLIDLHNRSLSSEIRAPYTQMPDMLRDAMRWACIRDRLAVEDIERAFEDCPMGSSNIDPEESKKTDAAIDEKMEAYRG